ncbi:hypothetical protein V5O48_009898 [Marasmius crinis-equi]|uniref:Uncharacterized protein n=1 Tax=Marasmius crinis-equi TaxID=585013 RepID=A0ABR3F9S5_9AGAR
MLKKNNDAVDVESGVGVSGYQADIGRFDVFAHPAEERSPSILGVPVVETHWSLVSTVEQFEFGVDPDLDPEPAMHQRYTTAPTSTANLSSSRTTTSSLSTAAPPFPGHFESLTSPATRPYGYGTSPHNRSKRYGSTFGRYGWIGYGGMGGNRGKGYEGMGTGYGGYVSLGYSGMGYDGYGMGMGGRASVRTRRKRPTRSQPITKHRIPSGTSTISSRRFQTFLRRSRALAMAGVIQRFGAMPLELGVFILRTRTATCASGTEIKPEALIVLLIAIFGTLYAMTKLIVEAMNARQHQHPPVPGALPPLGSSRTTFAWSLHLFTVQ